MAASPAGADPQPDAAPQPPAVAPDPAPDAAVQTPAPTPSEQSASTQPAPTTTGPPARSGTPTSTASANKRVAERPDGDSGVKRRRGTGQVAGIGAASAFRFKALFPPDSGAADAPSHEVLLAAGALLALVLASGSLVSVSSRAMKGHLR